MDAAYRIELPIFEGPLGLLLYVIRRNEIDIYDIPIVEVTRQYQSHLELMKELDLDVAGEYFEMAATLIRIKTRMLLPREEDEEGEEQDPRKELVDQLLEYQRMVEAAEFLERRREEAGHSLPRPPDAERPRPDEELVLEVDLFALVAAFNDLLQRRRLERPLAIPPQRFTVQEKMEEIRRMLAESGSVPFHAVFPRDADREEVVTAFLALLEMVKHAEIRCLQQVPRGEIRLYPAEESAERETTPDQAAANRAKDSPQGATEDAAQGGGEDAPPHGERPA